ncbi:MAG: hypothetical protein WC082_03725 [Victivallales bacterium]
MDKGNKNMDSFRNQFINPSEEFRPIPWWSWSGEMDYGEMEKQLEEMKAKGINEFFIFAIYGLDIPYMGKEWWERVEWTLKKCEKMGMKVWIYDDYNWPSGTCAGFLFKDHPWTKSKQLEFKEFSIKPGESLDFEPEDEFVGAVLYGADNKVETLIPEKILKGNKISWENKHGKSCRITVITRGIKKYGRSPFAFGAEWCTKESGYIDTLNYKAIEKFIEYTHLEYEKRFKKYFGSTLKGFFTDEPQLNNKKISYPSFIFAEFQEKYCYDLKTKLHELWEDTGNYQVTRYHFWSLLTGLFSLSYSKQISDWCAQKGLLSTGHLLGEEILAWSVVYSGDVYETLKWMQAPGMDLLQEETSYDSGEFWKRGGGKINRKALVITAKLISGTARFANRKRTMCEAFGVCDWSLTMEKQKRVMDWLSALGINLINDNLLIYTIKGFLKRAVSGKHFTSPWWKYYKNFTDYSARLSSVCANGILETDTGVLYPTANMWCSQKPQKNIGMGELIDSQPENLAEMQKSLYSVCDALLRIHRNYELLFDEVIANASVKNNCLAAGNIRFKTVILPGIEILRMDVYERLQEFADNGGRVIIIGKSPQTVIDVKNGCLKKAGRLAQAINIPLKQNDIDFENLLAAGLPLTDNCWTVEGRDKRQVISAFRKMNEDKILFLANQRKRKAQLRVSWNFLCPVSLWDPNTGEGFSVHPKKVKSSFVWNLTPYPHQAIFLLASEKNLVLPSIDNWTGKFERKTEKLITLNPEWRFRTETPNILLPRFKILPVAAGTDTSCHSLLTGKEKGWTKVTVDGKTQLELSPDKMAYFWLRAEINLEYIPENLSIIVDDENYSEVWLNESKLIRKEACSLWDSHNLKFPVGKYVRQGSNILLLKVSPSKYYAEAITLPFISRKFIEPVALGGSFAVKKQGRKEILIRENGTIRTGSWTDRGYPYFAGTGIYAQEIVLKHIPSKAYLKIEKAKEVIEVMVNDQAAGVRAWPPYIVDISGLLREGRNEIVIKVTNSFGNLIQMACPSYASRTAGIRSGILGAVHIIEGIQN